VAFGSRDKDVLSSIASRLSRLDLQLTREDRALLQEVNGGKPLTTITRGIVVALDPDAHVEAARQAAGGGEPTAEQIAQAADKLLAEAAKPLASNPALRMKILDIDGNMFVCHVGMECFCRSLMALHTP
jgi:type I restriction enzyme R subunit